VLDAPPVHVVDDLAVLPHRVLQRRVARAHDALAQVVEAVGDVLRVVVVRVVRVVREAVAGDARAGELVRGGRAEVGGADEGLRGVSRVVEWDGEGGRGSGVGGTWRWRILQPAARTILSAARRRRGSILWGFLLLRARFPLVQLDSEQD
jgi:hypothetical protein